MTLAQPVTLGAMMTKDKDTNLSRFKSTASVGAEGKNPRRMSCVGSETQLQYVTSRSANPALREAASKHICKKVQRGGTYDPRKDIKQVWSIERICRGRQWLTDTMEEAKDEEGGRIESLHGARGTAQSKRVSQSLAIGQTASVACHNV